MERRFTTVLAAGLFGATTLAVAQTPDERASARAVMAKRDGAVVTVTGSVRVRVRMGGREVQNVDEAVQAIATVLDETGLAVMSLSAVEPGGLMARMMSAAGGTSRQRMDITTEPSGLSMRLAQGEQVSARIVLRDEELNLAFLEPIDPPKARIAFVDGRSAKPGPFDLLVMMVRLGESSGWQTAAWFTYVQAVVDKPRTVYLMSGATTDRGLGAPVFDLAGRFVGVLVMKMTPGRPSGASMVGGLLASMGVGNGFGMMPVILPADDIRQIARQVAAR